MSTDPIDATQFPYKKAQRSPNACTDAELKALSAFFKAKVDANEALLASAWQNEVSDKCADCVFSDGQDAEWTPILVADDKLDTVNRGGCIEIVSGKEACGEAYQRVTECRVEACRIKCTTAGRALGVSQAGAGDLHGAVQGGIRHDAECMWKQPRRVRGRLQGQRVDVRGTDQGPVHHRRRRR